MPRPKRRIVTEQPLHVYGRGNYRKDVFATTGARQVFMEVLRETVLAYGWELYAFALLPNHYHLCVRTPFGNLSEGMHHLLTTYCSRFNRFRKEHGHVFQGRFQSKVAPRGISVRNIIDYIHLNLPRADFESVDRAAKMPESSLRDYLGPNRRDFLAVAESYRRFMGFDDNRVGWRSYRAELERQLATDPDTKAFESAWRAAELEDRQEARRKPGAIRPERRKTREEVQAEAEVRWEAKAAACIARDGLDDVALSGMIRRHPGKLLIARELRALGAPYAWIARRLAAGTAEYLSFNLRMSKGSGPDIGR